ncbi:MAG: hypothetical protein K0R54_4754 [Clostridiaceae bacterium]|nr:hypothetical protein [Clostridiaceae bacterium]
MTVRGKRVLITIAALLITIGIIFMCTDVLYPRNRIIQGSLDGREGLKIEKYEKDNYLYVSFKQQNKENILECTKDQYEFMTNDKQIYILYRENYFNRNKGKILKVDDVPISNYFRGM